MMMMMMMMTHLFCKQSQSPVGLCYVRDVRQGELCLIYRHSLTDVDSASYFRCPAELGYFRCFPFWTRVSECLIERHLLTCIIITERTRTDIRTVTITA